MGDDLAAENDRLRAEIAALRLRLEGAEGALAVLKAVADGSLRLPPLPHAPPPDAALDLAAIEPAGRA